MATNYPSSYDTLAKPTPTTDLDDAGFEHDVVHTNAADAIEALQAKVGLDGDTASSTGTVEARLKDLDQTKLDASDNAVSASRWQTSRTLTLSGDVSGSTSWDGSANASISVVVADDSHTHSIYSGTSHHHDSDYVNETDHTKAVHDALGIRAATADQLTTARTISLTGDVSGSTSFDGSSNVSISAVVANDSHSHSNYSVTSHTHSYLPLAGGTMSGNINLNGNNVYGGSLQRVGGGGDAFINFPSFQYIRLSTDGVSYLDIVPNHATIRGDQTKFSLYDTGGSTNQKMMGFEMDNNRLEVWSFTDAGASSTLRASFGATGGFTVYTGDINCDAGHIQAGPNAGQRFGWWGTSEYMTRSASTIHFYTSGVNRFDVTSSGASTFGNHYISGQLDVDGDVHMATGYSSLTWGGDTRIGASSGANIEIVRAGVAVMTIGGGWVHINDFGNVHGIDLGHNAINFRSYTDDNHQAIYSGTHNGPVIKGWGGCGVESVQNDTREQAHTTSKSTNRANSVWKEHAASTHSNNSDARFKHNVRTRRPKGPAARANESALKRIKSLGLYEWDDDPRTVPPHKRDEGVKPDKRFGIMADELEKVVPEAVHKATLFEYLDPEDEDKLSRGLVDDVPREKIREVEVKTVSTAEMDAFLLEAIQELVDRVEALESAPGRR